MVYEVTVTYTVEVTDRSALMTEAFERFCRKLRPGEKVTAWHFEQWQRWVDDGTEDPPSPAPRGVDVALFEFLDPDGRLTDIPGARVMGWSRQQQRRHWWQPGEEDFPEGPHRPGHA